MELLKRTLNLALILAFIFLINVSAENAPQLKKRYEEFLSRFSTERISEVEIKKVGEDFEKNFFLKLGLPKNTTTLNSDLVEYIKKNESVILLLRKNYENTEKVQMDWDEIHRISKPELYLSPVYVNVLFDGTGSLLRYSDFCSGKIQFTNTQAYKQFLWGAQSLHLLTLIKADFVLDLAYSRCNRVPSISSDTLLQAILLAYVNEMPIFSDESKKKMKEMLGSKNPGYRLTALKGLKQFAYSPEDISTAIRNALKEKNQAFAYLAFQNLQYLEASEAQNIALQYLKNCDTESDGTACDVNENFKEFMIKSLPSNVSDISKLLLQIKK